MALLLPVENEALQATYALMILVGVFVALGLVAFAFHWMSRGE